jgi:hypothetical protein
MRPPAFVVLLPVHVSACGNVSSNQPANSVLVIGPLIVTMRECAI